MIEDAGSLDLMPDPPDFARCGTGLGPDLGGIFCVYTDYASANHHASLPTSVFCSVVAFLCDNLSVPSRAAASPSGLHSAPARSTAASPPRRPLPRPPPRVFGVRADLFSRPRGPRRGARSHPEINTRAARGRQNSAATSSDAGRRPVAQTAAWSTAERQRRDSAARDK